MPQPVFISYARRDAATQAAALHAALGPERAFLDSDAIESEDIFPRRLALALEGAQVVVVLATATYFQRWYCLREWMAALLPWTSADPEHRTEKGDQLLRHLVVAINPALTEADRERLPPPIRQRNLAAIADTRTLAGVVSSRLAASLPTLGARCSGGRRGAEILDLFTGDGALPLVAQSTAGLPVWPTPLRPSLGEQFIGRGDEFWQIHELLWTRRMGGREAAARVAALHAGGGFGKTQLGLEYLHRMGPRLYRDGLFWVDASEAAQPLDEQQRGILRTLGEPDGQVQKLTGGPLRSALAARLSERAGTSMLFVVDNLPEPSTSAPPRELSDYCPALGTVTCLVTSRARRDLPTIDLDVVSVPAAILLLQRGLPLTSVLSRSEWTEIVEWVGRLPLALDLLNSSLQGGALSPKALLDGSRKAEVSPRLEALASTLKDEMPPGAIRGIADAFGRSLVSLPASTRALAMRCGWLPPAPIPRRLLEALAEPASAEADVQKLVRRSFLRLSSGAAESLQMHRVMASFLRESSDHPAVLVGDVAAAISGALATLDPRDETFVVLLAPHVADVANRLVAQPGTRPPLAQARELLEQMMLVGERTSAVAPLTFAAAGARAVLARADSTVDPATVGQLNRILGRCLYGLGTRQANVALLEEAMAANRASLHAWQRASQPAEWARVRNQMGATLQEWGEGEADGVRLDEALVAYEEALSVQAQHRLWLDWAGTQNNLGNALMAKALRTESQSIVERAIDAYRGALSRYQQPDSAIPAADVERNLGTALRLLGEITGDLQHFAAAEGAFLAARAAYPRDRERIRWAASANNLALLRITWGARAGDVAKIHAAVEDLCASLEIRRRDDLPRDWAMVQNNLGRAFTEIGIQEQSATALRRAIVALKRALKVRQRSALPLEWATTTRHLGRALKELGTLRASTKCLDRAARAYDAALSVYDDKAPSGHEWAMLQRDIGDLLAVRARLGDDSQRAAAAAAYRLALTVFAGTPRADEITARLNQL